MLTLWIEDPASITIQGTGGAVAEFTCGAQKDMSVAIGYTPEENKQRGTAGVVRLIEFR